MEVKNKFYQKFHPWDDCWNMYLMQSTLPYFLFQPGHTEMEMATQQNKGFLTEKEDSIVLIGILNAYHMY